MIRRSRKDNTPMKYTDNKMDKVFNGTVSLLENFGEEHEKNLMIN